MRSPERLHGGLFTRERPALICTQLQQEGPQRAGLRRRRSEQLLALLVAERLGRFVVESHLASFIDECPDSVTPASSNEARRRRPRRDSTRTDPAVVPTICATRSTSRPATARSITTSAWSGGRCLSSSIAFPSPSR